MFFFRKEAFLFLHLLISSHSLEVTHIIFLNFGSDGSEGSFVTANLLFEFLVPNALRWHGWDDLYSQGLREESGSREQDEQ